MYEALRTVAACYLRSDKEGIIDTLTAYNATEALYNVAAVEAAFLHSHCMARLHAEVLEAEAKGAPPAQPRRRGREPSPASERERGAVILPSLS